MSKSNEYQTKNQESEFPVFLCVPGKVQYKTPGLYDFKIRGLCKMVSGTPTFQFIFTTCVQILFQKNSIHWFKSNLSYEYTGSYINYKIFYLIDAIP